MAKSNIAQLYFVWLLIFGPFATAQTNISPRLAENLTSKKIAELLLTVSVRDTALFKKAYGHKLTVLGNHGESKSYLIRLFKPSDFNELRLDSNVLFIDRHRKPEVEGIYDYVTWSFNRVIKSRNLYPDIKGNNQTISIKEESFDPQDINLINRSFTTSVTPTTISQHATSMATLVGGSGNSSTRSLGVAYKARFTSSDFNNLLPDNSSVFINNNIHLQNHSYGVGIENYYGNEAVAYDQQVYDNPSLLHIFSAGNNGKLKPTSGTYKDLEWANLTGNFKQSKNVLVVTAVDTSLVANAINSRGPAFDGRLKPELTAFGQSGTSEAAAVVSGISLLVQEKYQQGKQQLADASMVKAILIASADDFGSPGMDYQYGYGNVNAYKALTVIENNQLVTVTLTDNDQLSIPIVVSGSISEMKIAVSWSDPAGSPNSTSPLVNNIDSWLSDGTQVINPWVLSTYPSTDSLVAAPTRKRDDLNNTEYITLTDPAPGTYQLYVKSGVLKDSNQKVSIAWCMNEDKTFNWDFPISGDFMEGGEKNLLVWEAKVGQVGNLSIQTTVGHWQLIQSGINLDNYFYWLAPDTLSKAKLKMTIGQEEFLTDEFTISPKMNIESAFNCMDSIGLTWNSIKNAVAYELYTMGSVNLESVLVTNDTLIVLPQSTDKFYAVAPVFSETAGIKSETINSTQQGAYCYLNLFTAERLNAKQVRVQLQLSSHYLIDKIIFFKTAKGVRRIFKTVESGPSLGIEFYDSELIAGLMSYQAELVFKNGISIFSDVVEIPVEEMGKAVIYPNPVSDNDYLTILSSGEGANFQILDIYGRVLIEKEIHIVIDAIDVADLPSGIYFYRMISTGKLTDTGRFIKN